MKNALFYKFIVLPQELASLSNLRFFHYYKMILQCIRIIVGDAAFEPGTFAPEIWCATYEPPHKVSRKV